MGDEATYPWSWGTNPPKGCGPADRCHHHGRHGGIWGGPPWGMGLGPGGPGGYWHGRGPRARRGDIKTAILALLDEKPMHGYQIIQELSERSGGAWRPSPGSIYPTLQLLEDEGLVSAQEIEGKRVYELSEEGRKVLGERKSEAGMPWEQVAAGVGEEAQALRRAMFQVGAAAWQAGSTGTPEQAQKVIAILEEARKHIYGILAEGE